MTASLRREAYRGVAEAGGGTGDRARVGRACAFHGAAKLHADMRPWLDEATLRLLHDESLAWYHAIIADAFNDDTALVHKG